PDFGKASNLLASAEQRAGDPRGALAIREEKIAFYESLLASPLQNRKNLNRGTLFSEYVSLILIYTSFGRIEEAYGTLQKIDALVAQPANWKNVDNLVALFHSRDDWAHGVYLNAIGRYEDAEGYLRRAISENAKTLTIARATGDPVLAGNLNSIEMTQPFITLTLARSLTRQGRLAEAEAAAPQALLMTLKKIGPYPTETASTLPP